MIANPVRASAAAAAIVLALLVLSGCATIPREKSAADWLHVLPADSSYYLCITTGRGRDLAKQALKKSPYASREVDQLLDLTDQVYVGVRPVGGKPTFSLVMLGNYPTMLKSALSGSADWETVAGENPYWRHKKYGLQAALPYDYMVVIAQDNVEGLVTAARSGGAYSLSAEARDQIRRNDVTLLFPLGLDEAVADDLGVPLPKRIFEEIWIGARQRNDQFEFHGTFHVGPDSEPAALKKLLQFFLFALLRRNGVEDAGRRLAAMKVETEGRLVRISGLMLRKAELEALLSGVLGKGKQQ